MFIYVKIIPGSLITDEKLKLIASKANQGGCNDLLKYMSDLKWTGRHENFFRLKDVNGCGHTWDFTLVKGFNRGKKDVKKLYYSKTH